MHHDDWNKNTYHTEEGLMMKTFRYYATAVIAIVVCLVTFSVTGFAEASVAESPLKKCVSKPIAEPAIDIDAVIQKEMTDAIIKEWYSMFPDMKPEEYTVDTSFYLLEYYVSTDYWDEVTSFDYEGMTAHIDPAYPTIYIPIFGDIADTNGKIHNRAIGYFKLSYEPWIEKDYRLSSAMYNLASDDYKDGNVVGSYEKITDYLVKSKVDTRQVFLIRYPNSLSEEMEQIAVIQTENDTVILDVSNSLHIGTDIMMEATAYSIAEYREQRMELEKELYQTIGRWEDNPAGGNVLGRQDDDRNLWVEYLPFILGAVAILGGIVILVRMKYRKRSSKS